MQFYGQVIDSTGHHPALQGGWIGLRSWSTRQQRAVGPTRWAVVDGTGEFSFEDVPAGHYLLRTRLWGTVYGWRTPVYEDDNRRDLKLPASAQEAAATLNAVTADGRLAPPGAAVGSAGAESFLGGLIRTGTARP